MSVTVYIYNAFATGPFTSITYVEFKIVMFASLSVSFAVIVMFRILFTVARMRWRCCCILSGYLALDLHYL